MDFERFRVKPGDRVLDMGCGAGRHAFELYRRGAHVVAFDRDAEELSGVEKMFGAMRMDGEAPEDATAETVQGDALDQWLAARDKGDADGYAERARAARAAANEADLTTAARQLHQWISRKISDRR